MQTDSINTKDAINVGFIGGAASTIATLTCFSRNLAASPILRNAHIGIYVFDPKGLNPGPGYSLRSPAFLLNQPAGQEMDFTLDGGPGLPPSFLKWLKGNGHQYTASSFPPRGTSGGFGSYLEYVAEWQRQKLTAGHNLHEIKDSIHTITPCNGFTYKAQTTTHGSVYLNGFVLATGHSYTPRLRHGHYLAAYYGEDYEQRLEAAAQDSAIKLFIGSGASAADNIGALEYYGYRGDYRVISPYGNTCWPYNPDAPHPPDGRAKSLVDAFVECPENKKNPSDALRSLLKQAAGQAVAPQYILSACLTHEKIWRDERLLKAVKTFYGNPLSPERFDLLSRVEKEGRLHSEAGYVRNIASDGDNLLLDINGTSERFHGHVIDCAIIGRGIRNARSEIANPLIAQLVMDGIIRTSDCTSDALDAFTAPDRNIFSVGPLTNALKNGIETFRLHYHAVAAEFTRRLEILVTQPCAALTAASITSSPQP